MDHLKKTKQEELLNSCKAERVMHSYKHTTLTLALFSHYFCDGAQGHANQTHIKPRIFYTYSHCNWQG